MPAPKRQQRDNEPVTVTLTFAHARNTKGTAMYVETDGDSEQPAEKDKMIVGRLYIRKDALKRLGVTGAPGTITMALSLDQNHVVSLNEG